MKKRIKNFFTKKGMSQKLPITQGALMLICLLSLCLAILTTIASCQADDTTSGSISLDISRTTANFNIRMVSDKPGKDPELIELTTIDKGKILNNFKIFEQDIYQNDNNQEDVDLFEVELVPFGVGKVYPVGQIYRFELSLYELEGVEFYTLIDFYDKDRLIIRIFRSSLDQVEDLEIGSTEVYFLSSPLELEDYIKSVLAGEAVGVYVDQSRSVMLDTTASEALIRLIEGLTKLNK